MSTVDEALAVALQQQQAGRLEAAEQICQQIVAAVPDHADAWHLLGLVNSQFGRHPLALDCLRRAVRLNPQAAVFWNNLGLVYQALRDVEEAVRCYRQALELAPRYAAAHANLGSARKEQGRGEEAIACYRHALQLNPADAWTHSHLGIALKEQGRWDEAAACYRRALALQPDFAEAHNNLGNVLQDQGQTSAAIASYRAALGLRPDYVEVHKNLGLALQEQGQLDEAVDCYRRVLGLTPDDAETHKNLGLALQEQGQLEAALACYRRVLALKPDSPDGKVHHSLGLAYAGMGRWAEAVEVWQDWLTSDPQNPVARHLVAAATGRELPARANDQYVRATFDAFAPTFERQLQQLDYRVPELIAAAVAKSLGAAQRTLDVLDAGCGTGWCGPLLRPYARRLTGIDLSSRMLERARARQLYDRLIEGELTAHLQMAGDRHDLIVSADTLVYFGDLQPVLTAAARALRPGGLLVFTLEHAPPGDSTPRGYSLQCHGRYCHTEAYVRCTLADVGLRTDELNLEFLRTERGEPVPGIVVAARKDAESVPGSDRGP